MRDLVIFLMTTGKISSIFRVGVVSHSHLLTSRNNSLILSERNRITHFNILLINIVECLLLLFYMDQLHSEYFYFSEWFVNVF